MKYEIKNRFTGEVKFPAEIYCAEDAPTSMKVGLSVRWAVKNGADLRDANLGGADLHGADLGDADLRDANLGGADLHGADLRDADLHGADLRDANLGGADLGGADLHGADLGGTCLIDGGQRWDGYRFVGWVKDGVLQIRAGCRNYTITAAREHWAKTRGGTALGDETMAILDHIETVARVRGLVPDLAAAAE